MRVSLKQHDLNMLFNSARCKHNNWTKLAQFLNISEKTLRDWRRRKTTLPYSSYTTLLAISSMSPDSLSPTLLSSYWHTKDAGKKGAHARMQLHGNFGTSKGRRRGGLASLITHQNRKTAFIMRKNIREVTPSKKLAELLGILTGDGHLSHYQVSMTTNSKTDMQHALYTRDLIKDLFHVDVSIKEKKGENAVNVVASSKNLVDFLSLKGMPVGNKIKNHLRAPVWIMNNFEYKKDFIRGLFDTDGCIYLDKHLIKGKTYAHLSWTITSYAGMLINDIIRIMKELGFSPTWRQTQRSVYLRKQHEIRRYFTEIGTSNNKHLDRLNQFKGEVPKWS